MFARTSSENGFLAGASTVSSNQEGASPGGCIQPSARLFLRHFVEYSTCREVEHSLRAEHWSLYAESTCTSRRRHRCARLSRARRPNGRSDAFHGLVKHTNRRSRVLVADSADGGEASPG